MKRKLDAPERSILDMRRGDYVRIGSTWHRIEALSDGVEGADQTPRNWSVTIPTGDVISYLSINRYACVEDMEE